MIGFLRRITGFCSAITAILCAVSAGAETYYVDGDGGNDAALGTSRMTAFQTLDHAVAALHPGDHLFIAGGFYVTPLKIGISGTADAPIEITGDPQNLPQIHVNDDAVSISANFIDIGFIDASSLSEGSAIDVTPGHHHVRIHDSIAHDSGCTGIGAVQADYITIEHNRVFGNAMRSIWQCSGISLYQARDADLKPGFHNIIRGNTSYGNTNIIPVDTPGDPAAGHTTDGNGIIVDDFQHTQIWMGQRTSPAAGATLVENNVVFGNGGRGIEVFHSDRVTVRNNTSFHNHQDRNLIPGRTAEIMAAYARDCLFVNNIAVPTDNETWGLLDARTEGSHWDYNLVAGVAPNRVRWSDDSDVWGEHLLIVPDAGFMRSRESDDPPDLHLTEDSAARGQGDPAQKPVIDADGLSRGGTAPTDIGAFQWHR